MKWRKYKLNFMIKRLEKRKNEPLNNLNAKLLNGVNLIGEAISEIEDGLKQLRNSVVYQETKAITKHKMEVKTNDVEVNELLLCGIKLHIKPEMLIAILQYVFHKRKILILLENNLSYLKNTVINFFDFIFEDSFKINIVILIKAEFLKKDYFYGDYIIFEKGNVSGSALIEESPNGSKSEEEIIETYFRENDVNIGRENLRYKIQEIYALSKAILEFYRMRGNILVLKAARKHLENIFFLKIKKDYFHFLTDIVKNYFNIEIKYAKDYVADQIAQLMGT